MERRSSLDLHCLCVSVHVISFSLSLNSPKFTDDGEKLQLPVLYRFRGSIVRSRLYRYRYFHLGLGPFDNGGTKSIKLLVHCALRPAIWMKIHCCHQAVKKTLVLRRDGERLWIDRWIMSLWVYYKLDVYGRVG